MVELLLKGSSSILAQNMLASDRINKNLLPWKKYIKSVAKI